MDKQILGEGLNRELEKWYDMDQISAWTFDLYAAHVHDLDEDLNEILEHLCGIHDESQFDFTKKHLRLLADRLLKGDEDPLRGFMPERDKKWRKERESLIFCKGFADKEVVGQGLKRELEKGYDMDRMAAWALDLYAANVNDLREGVDEILEYLFRMNCEPKYKFTETDLHLVADRLIKDDEDPLRGFMPERDKQRREEREALIFCKGFADKEALGQGLKRELEKGYDITRISSWAYHIFSSMEILDDGLDEILEYLFSMDCDPQFEFTEAELHVLADRLLADEEDPLWGLVLARNRQCTKEKDQVRLLIDILLDLAAKHDERSHAARDLRNYHDMRALKALAIIAMNFNEEDDDDIVDCAAESYAAVCLALRFFDGGMFRKMTPLAQMIVFRYVNQARPELIPESIRQDFGKLVENE